MGWLSERFFPAQTQVETRPHHRKFSKIRPLELTGKKAEESLTRLSKSYMEFCQNDFKDEPEIHEPILVEKEIC